MQKKEKVAENIIIIGNKDINVYVSAIVRCFYFHNYVILQCPKSKIDVANIIASNFKFCSNEDYKRKEIQVRKEYNGQKIIIDAIQVRLDLFPALRVIRI